MTLIEFIKKCNSNNLKIDIRVRECSFQQVSEIATNFGSHKTFYDEDIIIGTDGKEKVKEAKPLNIQYIAATLFIKGNQIDLKAAPLPTEAQTGPILNIQGQDICRYGHLGICDIGAIHQAEGGDNKIRC